MKGDNPAKHFLIAFLIAAALYAMSYSWIENRRNRKGPWEVTFTNSASGPAMIIDQAWLGLTNVTIVFDGESVTGTNGAPITGLSKGNKVEFRAPRPVRFAVPFGECVFEDLTFLPGTVTFQMFGHEIELLPRVMVIDLKEREWRSGEIITLTKTNSGVRK